MPDDPGTLEDLLTLREATALVPRRRGGKRCSLQCLYRWTTAGCRGVVLQYRQAGATRCTTRRWVDEFFDALTAQSRRRPVSQSEDRSTPLLGVRSGTTRLRAIERADREADALGA